MQNMKGIIVCGLGVAGSQVKYGIILFTCLSCAVNIVHVADILLIYRANYLH